MWPMTRDCVHMQPWEPARKNHNGQLIKPLMATPLKSTCLIPVLSLTGMETEILQYGGAYGWRDNTTSHTWIYTFESTVR